MSLYQIKKAKAIISHFENKNIAITENVLAPVRKVASGFDFFDLTTLEMNCFSEVEAWYEETREQSAI